MSKLDDDIRRVLASEEEHYDLDKEEGVFRQVAGLYRGKMRWMAIVVTVESVVFLVLMILAAVHFFRTEDTKWQIFYATGILLLANLLVLIKMWGWMQMNGNAIRREIKRLELRMLELGGQTRE